MISKLVLKKLLAIAVVGASTVGYVSYQSGMGDLSGNGSRNDQNKMIRNMSMFSTAYISNNSNRIGVSGKKKRGSAGYHNDDVSLLGSKGRYDYSRIGKTP